MLYSKNAILIGYILLLLSSRLLAEPLIYKCKTEQGDIHYQKTPCAENNAQVSSWTAIAKPAPPAKSLIIPAGEGGHYFIDGQINNTAINFVVDTGASVVALPYSLPFVRQLKCRAYANMDTANGNIRVCAVNLEKFNFGGFQLENVTAVIMPNLSQALLGMNVLKQFTLEQKENELRLFKRD
jgi:clan AA aspartic protease (TIGR02281 family)